MEAQRSDREIGTPWRFAASQTPGLWKSSTNAAENSTVA
jgi:hypothetical protein